MNKKWIAIGGAVAILTAVTTAGAQTTNVTVGMDPGVQYKFNGQQKALPAGYTSLQYQGHYYVPVRFVAENLGATADFDGTTKVVSLNGGTSTSGQQTASQPATSADVKSAVTDLYVNYSSPKDALLKESMILDVYMGVENMMSLNFGDLMNGETPKSIDFSQEDSLMSKFDASLTDYLQFYNVNHGSADTATRLQAIDNDFHACLNALKRANNDLVNHNTTALQTDTNTYLDLSAKIANEILDAEDAITKNEANKVQPYFQAPQMEVSGLKESFQRSRVVPSK